MSRRLCASLAGTFAWMFLLFNVERVFPRVDLASFVYAWATVLVVGLMTWKRLRRLSPLLLIGAALTVSALAKWALGYDWSWETAPVTAVEAASLVVTILLTLRVLRQIDDFQGSVDQLESISRGRRLPSLHDVEPAMSREMQRARRHDRPLAVVALDPQIDSSSQREILQRALEAELLAAYAAGQVGQLLLNETKSSDIVAYEDGRFLLLLPETNDSQAESLMERLAVRCREQFGVELKGRRSQFPADEITLSGLMSRVVAPVGAADPVADERESTTPREVVSTAH